MTAKGNYHPADLYGTFLLQPPRPFLFSTAAFQAVHANSSRADWLEPSVSKGKILHAHRSILPLLQVPFPEMPLIHITFLVTAEVPSQSDISTLWPTCLPQHESLTTVSPWYDCSCTHPICQRALFPATCCAFLEITKTISAHDNAFKASSHISPQLFVNDTATELELETRAATVKWLKIHLDRH